MYAFAVWFLSAFCLCLERGIAHFIFHTVAMSDVAETST
jgi:hypothetical protein